MDIGGVWTEEACSVIVFRPLEYEYFWTKPSEHNVNHSFKKVYFPNTHPRELGWTKRVTYSELVQW